MLSYVFEIDGVHYLLEIGRSLATVHSIENTLLNFSLYILIVIVLITTVSDIAYTQYLLKPLQYIILKLKNIKDPSSLQNKKIDTSTTDFTYLDDNIDEMMHRMFPLYQDRGRSFKLLVKKAMQGAWRKPF